ncbi:MAG: hypothetical protein HY815_00340 [Candidatus Riflebacteria bacterium]|nr:hypothetical protein [Candidatus Riflebacteria bacterium]
MTKRTMEMLTVLALLSAVPTAGVADDIELKDGSTVRGELVGYDNGNYTVRIGRFTRSIPESQVADVRSGGASTAAPATAPAPAPARAGQPPAGTVPAAGASTARPAAVPRIPLPGGAMPSPDDLKGVLNSLGVQPGAGGADTTGQAAGIIQQIMGTGGSVDPGQIEALKNNPFMQKLVDRFKDPRYQESLLEGVREMQQKINPGQDSPMLDQLKGLFEQLNTLQSGAGGLNPNSGRSSPGEP